MFKKSAGSLIFERWAMIRKISWLLLRTKIVPEFGQSLRLMEENSEGTVTRKETVSYWKD
jgi:hypothetical protein